MMSGLPASGKSTKAEELLKEWGNGVRLNRDLLRTMLHFDKFTGRNEGLTQEAQMQLARYFLGKNLAVIIDDTNLGKSHEDRWSGLAKETGATFRRVRVSTSMEDCLIRDRMREDCVGKQVIVGMALQYGLYPKPEKGFVLCDLDGTLADISHRLKFVKGMEKPDWKSFFASISEDKVHENVLEMVLEFDRIGYEIVFVSARPDTYREQTEVWLESVFKGYPIYKALIMRRGNDRRPDTEVKKDILDTYFGHYKSLIHKVIDDRPSVIRMWRENGLDVIDVGSGVEF